MTFEAVDRPRAAEPLSAILQTLGQTADINVALTAIARAVALLTGGQYAQVWDVDTSGHTTTLRAVSGESEPQQGPEATLAFGQGLAGWVALHPEPTVVEDYARDARCTAPDWWRAQPARSVFAVPVVGDGMVLAVLMVVSMHPCHLTPEQQTLLNMFVLHAGALLKQARLLRAEEHRRQAAESLADVARLMSQSLDPREVGARIAASLLQLFHAARSAIYLLEPGTQQLVLFACGGPPDQGNARLPRGHGAVGLAVQEGRPIVTPDVLTDPRITLTSQERARIAPSDYRSALAVPLVSKGKIIGTVSIGNHRDRQYTAEEIRLAETFAHQAAIALENARLFADAQARWREAEVIADLARAINASLDLDIVLLRIVKGAQELCTADIARIGLLESGQDFVLFRVSSGLHAPALHAQQPVERGKGMGGLVLANGRPLRTSDYASDSRLSKDYADRARAEGVVASLCVPIVVDGRMAGLLHIDNRSARPFTERDETILCRLADHAAIAIENARLYREAREVRGQLVQAQKMEAIGRLAGGIAHDFNNLLTVILGRAEAMRHTTHNPHLLRYAALIERAAQRAAELTKQLLAFSRRQVLHPRLLNLSAVVSDLDPMLRRLLPEDIELHTHLTPTPPQVKADPGQIEQVVMNLVLNARDAMLRGGRLTLTTAHVDWPHAAFDRPADIPPGRWVTLTVQDTGVGMDAETLARIFEPFYTTKEIGKGTGLGLATVYGIVQQSGGHIGVKSRPGAGTEFIVALPPAAEATPLTVSAEPTPEVQYGSETVLLLEDDENVRETTADILTAHGYTVLLARSAEEAQRLAMAHAPPIHLLLTDVIMPDTGGPAAAAQLLALRPTMKILYMSGYPADEMVRHGLEEDTVHFLAKPFSMAALIRKVREALEDT